MNRQSQNQIRRRLQKRGSRWYLRLRTPKGPRLVSTGCTDVEQAIAKVQESGALQLEQVARVNALTNATLSLLSAGRQVSVNEAINDYITKLSDRRSEKHTENSRCCLTHWASSVGTKLVAEINERDISAFVNAKDGVKASTRKLRLCYIRRFMDYCRDSGLITGNPARLTDVNMRNLTHADKEAKVVSPYADTEIADILTGIRKLISATTSFSQLTELLFWEQAIKIAHATGLRFGDVVCLEWDSVGAGVVHTKKTGARVKPEAAKEVEAILEKWPRRGPFVFPDSHSIYMDVKRRSYFSQRFKTLCLKMGCVYRGLHAIRHGFATRMAENHSVEAVGQQLGHSNPKTTQGYIHQ